MILLEGNNYITINTATNIITISTIASPSMTTLRTALSLALKIRQLLSSSSSSSSSSLSSSSSFVPIVGGYPIFVYMVGLGLGYDLENSSSIFQQCIDTASKVSAILN